MFKHDYLLRECEGKKVLHFGAVDYPYHNERMEKGTLLHYKLSKVCKLLIGVDNNAKGIADLKRWDINNIYYGDIVKDKFVPKVLNNVPYDVVLLPDIIEHLINPGVALENIKKFCDEKTIVIITVPNAWSIFNLKNHFRKVEVVHPDHYFWTSLLTTTKLIKDSGFEIISVDYALSGSKNDKRSFKGRLFNKLILNHFEFLKPTLIFKTKLKKI